MAILHNGPYQVEYYESSEASPQEAYDPTSGRATRKILVHWEDREIARLAFMGHPVLQGNNPATGLGGWIVRIPPHRYPNDQNLYVQGQPQVEPIGFRGRDNPDTDTLDISRYEWAKLTLTYTNVTYNILSDAEVDFGDNPDEGAALAAGISRYITKTVHPGGKIMNLNRGFMRRVTNDMGIVPEGIPVYFPTLDVTYTHHMVPLRAVPLQAIQNSLGTLNHDTFDGEPAGCMLLQSAEPSRPMMAPDGTRVCDLQIKFRIQYNVGLYVDPEDKTVKGPRINGHNFILFMDRVPESPTKGKLLWCMVTSDGTKDGTPPYRSTDMAKLFKPDQP